jgi:flagellar biogenesis protein FliO
MRLFLSEMAFIAGENGPLSVTEPMEQALQAVDVPPGHYGMELAKVMLTLTALMVLLGLTVWFLRRFILHKLQKGSGTEEIHILEKRMISPKTMLYLVEVNQQKILLAESQLEIRRLQIFGERSSLESN